MLISKTVSPNAQGISPKKVKKEYKLQNQKVSFEIVSFKYDWEAMPMKSQGASDIENKFLSINDL